MGMALSATSDRPTKAGLVYQRFRKRWNRRHHDNGGNHGNNNSSGPDNPSTPIRTGKRSVVPGLPRLGTVKRQQSEMRDRLKPVEPSPMERRRAPLNPGFSPVGSEAPPVHSATSIEAPVKDEREVFEDPVRTLEAALPVQSQSAAGPNESQPPSLPTAEAAVATDSVGDSDDGTDSRHGEVVRSPIEEELDWKWILNLSMHFRDHSDREKFFVTYAERPNLRRRLTVSCDYRGAMEGSLERELALLRYQRDKSAKIYDAIRDSLTDIQFYDTITNLKLQTSNGRLHVHVTEDLLEIIPYPPVIAIAHLQCNKYRESDLEFDSHLSGFVYKVKVRGEVFIKKEIPGPDTVDEFLYEINALYALAGSENVIRFGGCVVDDKREKVKGLLISFASRGALIDIIYHERGRLPWKLREKWARQIVSGLSEVHEAGYVQGDFTLSNIVIDEKDDAKIIDINRRGCPVGWEPPEVTAMIGGLQRIGMYIGVKSDIFQLGMVLWGIAHERDEPEAMPRPLNMYRAPEEVPQYFRDIVEACLSDRPQVRPSAKDLIALFPGPTISDGDSMPRYGDRGESLPVTDGRLVANGYDYARAREDGGAGNGLGINGIGDSHGTSGLLNGKLSRRSDSALAPLRLEDSSFQRGSLESPSEDASPLSERPGSGIQDFYEDAPQVIEAAPSETSGDEPFIPNIIESAPPQPFERPPLERYSTANDQFNGDADWAKFMASPRANGRAKVSAVDEAGGSAGVGALASPIAVPASSENLWRA